MYRKFSADHIFNGYQVLGGGYVLITDEKGVVIEITEETNAGDDIERYKGVLTPGFINAHCHLELSHMKGYIPEKTGLTDFILKVVFDRHFSEDKIMDAIAYAEKEMLQNGIVAVGDICNNNLTIRQKRKHHLLYHNFIEASGFPPTVAEMRFQRSEEFYQEYRSLFPASSIVPHAPYSVSPEMFRMINDFPGNNILTIHNQETEAENELFKNKKGDFLQMYQKMNIDVSFFNASGKSSIKTYLPSLNKNKSLLLVHNVSTSLDDIRFEQEQSKENKQQTYYCLCPNPNMYITGMLPDVPLFIKENCNIVLGTDSLASNHQLSILEEIKTLQKNFPKIDLQTFLQWATINGARALQMDNELGNFEKGKTPGIILIEHLENENISNDSAVKRIL